jgi:RNA polymerase sigma factor (sigma-70 family)
MKKKLTPEEEREILNECIVDKRCEKLSEQYRNLIYRTVQKTFIYKNAPLIKEELEEVQQDVFVQLFDDDCRRLRQYKEGGGRNLAGWIILIANRTALNHLRVKDPHAVVSRQYLMLFEDIREEFDIRQEINRLEARQQLMKIIEAVKQLAPLEKKVFTMHYIEDLSLTEIAARLNREIGNIYTIKSRSVKRLKEFIGE